MFEIISGNLSEGVNYQVIGGTILYNSINYSDYFIGVSGETTYTIVSGTPKVYEASFFNNFSILEENDFYLGLFQDESNFYNFSINLGEAYRIELIPDVENLINIRYKDGQKWKSINNIETNWSAYNERLTENNVRQEHLQPIEVVDNWGGREFTVQLTKFKGYFVELQITEDQIHDFENLLSCSDLQITDVKSENTFIANTEKIEYTNLEITQIAGTTKYNVILKFRTEKTVINKKESINKKYTLTANSNNYYTDIELIEEQKETYQNVYNNDTEIDKLTLAIPKRSVNVLFYLDVATKNNLKKDYETHQDNFIQLDEFENSGAKLVNQLFDEVQFDSDISNLRTGQKCQLNGFDVVIKEVVDNNTLKLDPIYNYNLGSNLLVSKTINFIEPGIVKISEIGEELYRCEINGTIND